MNLKQFILGLAVLGALVVGGLAGWGSSHSASGPIPVAYADDQCDNSLPPPGVWPCPPTPTPTATPTPPGD